MIVTCEHADNRVDPPLAVTEHDAPWLESHWGWDPGARLVARSIIDETESAGVFSTFSRLVCDPNRHPDDPTWIRREVEGGRVLDLNREVDAAERARRRTLYHDPYHDAVDALLHERLDHDLEVWLISVHSFTPQYLGLRRKMELGVLFDDFDDHAAHLARLLRARGFETALNAPYSGYDHLMYAATRHGRNHALHYLELEVRQDLILDPADATRVGVELAGALVTLINDADAGRIPVT